MLYYNHSQIRTVEIPCELSLAFQVVGCPIHCPACNAKWSWDIHLDEVTPKIPLTAEAVRHVLIAAKSYPSCVLFLGGDWDPSYLCKLLARIKKHNKIKTALYTGRTLAYLRGLKLQNFDLLRDLDYVKVGAYDEALGGLKSIITNQILYTVKDGEIKENITPLFWREYGD